MTSIDAHNVIPACDEEKSSCGVEGQSLQISAAGIPFCDDVAASHINGDGYTRVFDVCVEKPAVVIDGVAFCQIVERNF